MPAPLPLIVFFLLGTVLGIIRTYRKITAARRGIPAQVALYTWRQRRLSAWKYEQDSSVSILVHTLAVMSLGGAAVTAAFKPATITSHLLAGDPTGVILIWLVEGGSIALTGYLLGSALAFPLASLGRAPVMYGVSEDGMIYGSRLLPWRWFSHFTYDTDKRLLRLYSSFAPNLPSYVAELPEAVPVDQVVIAIEGHLPQGANPQKFAWYQTKYGLLPLMVLICLPWIFFGWVATNLPRELALFPIALFTTLLIWLGGYLLTYFGFGTSRVGAKKTRKRDG